MLKYQIIKDNVIIITKKFNIYYNLTAVALNKILKENKIQYKQSSQWLLYAEHLNKGFVK